jgi:uncharacterized membrane protein
MFIMLAGASVVSVLIWRVRSEISGTGHYAFLIWNLFLAWIPFLISYFTYIAALQRRQVLLLAPIAAFFWLIFFPNAPYMLTDFQHLARNWQEMSVWFDVMLLIWFSFTGLMLGMTSLFMMQEVIRRALGHWAGWGFVAVVTGFSSAGVYVGRFLRWNSWDIFYNPTEMAQYTLQGAQNPSLQSLSFTGLFGTLLLFLYITLYTFGHLLLERQKNEPI